MTRHAIFLALRDEYPENYYHTPALACTCRKTLTLAITFEPVDLELSYFICIFLVLSHFYRYQNFAESEVLIGKCLERGTGFICNQMQKEHCMTLILKGGRILVIGFMIDLLRKY